jgi:YbbR domain-containing protein
MQRYGIAHTASLFSNLYAVYELVMRVNRSIRTWWRRFMGYIGTLLLSVVMGLIVWLIAINQENPLQTQPYPDPLPVVVRNLAPGLTPTELLDDQQVEVVLQAPQSAWEGLAANEITAYVDLANLGRGTHLVPVHVAIDEREVVLKGQEPTVLTVELDTVITKTVPVLVEIMDNTAYGYDPQPPIVEPTEIAVTGPAQQVELVTQARTRVFMRNARSQVERFQNVELLNDHQQPVELVTASPSVVEVIVPVQAWPGSKQVAVRVDLQGQPANGFRLGPLTVSPNTVSLRGSSNLLNDIAFVATEPISVTGGMADLYAQLRLLLPEGVTAYDTETPEKIVEMVDVVVGVLPVEDSRRMTLRLLPRGLASELRAEIALDTVEVILSGPKNILDALNSDDMYAFVDLDNQQPGSYVLRPTVVIPTGIRQEGVLPETVEVVISNGITTTAPALPLTLTAPVTMITPMTGTVAPTVTNPITVPATVLATSTPTATGTPTRTLRLTPTIPATSATRGPTPTEEE